MTLDTHLPEVFSYMSYVRPGSYKSDSFLNQFNPLLKFSHVYTIKIEIYIVICSVWVIIFFYFAPGFGP